MSSDSIALNITNISTYIKTKTIEKVIEQKFSKNHLRIFRLLHLCGALDARNIMDICLITPKNCNMILNQLYSEGFIETQMVNVRGSNILFYFVNVDNLILKSVDMVFKMIRNLKIEWMDGMDKMKNKVGGNVMEGFVSKMAFAIEEMVDTVIVLKYL